MLIDWFTVAAQALNFLILVWLMKRFLFKPIRNAIDAREQRIAAELADADAKRTEARRERDEFRLKNEDLDRQRTALLSKAADEAESERQRLLDEARSVADAFSAKRRETLANEARALHQALASRVRQEVFAIARKALTDLASTSLEERLAEVFIQRLRAMDGKARARFAKALTAASEPALVRSTFELPEAQRAAIRNAVDETFAAGPATPPGAGPRVRFETAPDRIGGIELTTNGQKVAWSIADYLTSLETSVGELLGEPDAPAANAEVGGEAPNSETRNQ